DSIPASGSSLTAGAEEALKRALGAQEQEEEQERAKVVRPVLRSVQGPIPPLAPVRQSRPGALLPAREKQPPAGRLSMVRQQQGRLLGAFPIRERSQALKLYWQLPSANAVPASPGDSDWLPPGAQWPI